MKVVNFTPYFYIKLPENYAFSVCRIEPENNIHVILEAFSAKPDFPLVIVGNWQNSAYGLELKSRFDSYQHLGLLNPIYDATNPIGLYFDLYSFEY